jgi:hypothetical protein
VAVVGIALSAQVLRAVFALPVKSNIIVDEGCQPKMVKGKRRVYLATAPLPEIELFLRHHGSICLLVRGGRQTNSGRDRLSFRCRF